LSAATVVALGYFVLFVDFTNHGRVWDMLAARVPVLARIIPSAAHDQSTVVTKSGPAAETAYGSRTLITAEQAQAPAEQQPAAASAATAAPAQTAGKKMTPPHLTSSLSGFDVRSAPSQTSASLDAAPIAPQAAPAAPAAAGAAAAQPQDASGTVIAAKASYGAASRSEMMGQAAGPVYNLKGRSKKK
jgi:hypothetical protein